MLQADCRAVQVFTENYNQYSFFVTAPSRREPIFVAASNAADMALWVAAFTNEVPVEEQEVSRMHQLTCTQPTNAAAVLPVSLRFLLISSCTRKAGCIRRIRRARYGDYAILSFPTTGAGTLRWWRRCVHLILISSPVHNAQTTFGRLF